MPTANDVARFKSLLDEHAREIRTLLVGSDAADDSIEVDNVIGRLTRMEVNQARQCRPKAAVGRRPASQESRPP